MINDKQSSTDGFPTSACNRWLKLIFHFWIDYNRYNVRLTSKAVQNNCRIEKEYENEILFSNQISSCRTIKHHVCIYMLIYNRKNLRLHQIIPRADGIISFLEEQRYHDFLTLNILGGKNFLYILQRINTLMPEPTILCYVLKHIFLSKIRVPRFHFHLICAYDNSRLNKSSFHAMAWWCLIGVKPIHGICMTWLIDIESDKTTSIYNVSTRVLSKK